MLIYKLHSVSFSVQNVGDVSVDCLGKFSVVYFLKQILRCRVELFADSCSVSSWGSKVPCHVVSFLDFLSEVLFHFAESLTGV